MFPADGDFELMSCLSTAALTDIRGPQHGPKTSLWAEPWLGNINIRLFEMLSGAVNSSKHRTHLKRDCSAKAKILCSDSEGGDKGSRFKVRCPKMSLKKLTGQVPRSFICIATADEFCVAQGHGLKACRCERGGGPGPGASLSTDTLAQGSGHGCPKPPLTLRCAGVRSRGWDNWSPLKSESRLATLSLAWNFGQEEGSAMGHLAFSYCFSVCFLNFRHEGRYIEKTLMD